MSTCTRTTLDLELDLYILTSQRLLSLSALRAIGITLFLTKLRKAPFQNRSCERSPRRVSQRDQSQCDPSRLRRPPLISTSFFVRVHGSLKGILRIYSPLRGLSMSQDNSRGQKRKPEDGHGPSSHSHKRLREEIRPRSDPESELYWVVQWYAAAETVTPMQSYIHRCLPGDHLSTRNTRRGMGMVY